MIAAKMRKKSEGDSDSRGAYRRPGDSRHPEPTIFAPSCGHASGLSRLRELTPALRRDAKEPVDETGPIARHHEATLSAAAPPAAQLRPPSAAMPSPTDYPQDYDLRTVSVSEQDIEDAFIGKLRDLKYTDRPDIRDRANGIGDI